MINSQTLSALLCAVLMLSACGGKATQDDRPSEKAAVAQQQENQSGEAGTNHSLSESANAVGSKSEQNIQSGKSVYQSNCIACHGAEGKGIEGTFPPLAGSDYLKEDPKRLIRAIVKGVSGPISVNGVKYDNMMPASAMSDEDAADVATYILNSFGNGGGYVSAADVAAERSK